MNSQPRHLASAGCLDDDSNPVRVGQRDFFLLIALKNAFPQACRKDIELRSIRRDESKLLQSGFPIQVRLAIQALPGVDSKVMMIVTESQKVCAVCAPVSRQFEAQSLLVEGQRPLEVCDSKVHMPDPC